MRSKDFIAPLAVLATAALLAGCGVRVTLSGPSQSAPNAPINYTLGWENPGVCPVGDVGGLVVPLLRTDDIEIDGDEELAEFLLSLLAALCSGTLELPDGIVCEVVDNTIVCEVEGGLGVGTGEASVSTPLGPLLSCRRQGSSIACSAAEQGGGAAAAFGARLAQVISCVPDNGEFDCSAPRIDPGQTLTTVLNLTAPGQPGLYTTFAIAGAADRGVCKDGTNQGGPCGSDGDCPGGSVGSCGDGICIDDTTQATGAGCDDDAECAAGESCVECDPDDGAFVFPLACSQLTIGVAAPATSNAALALGALMVLALGLFGVARRRAM